MLIKEALFQYCQQRIQQMISMAEQAIADARQSSANDTKSSAGDKYETGRAMAQQEIDLNTRQFAEAKKLQHHLQQIDPLVVCKFIQTGALAETGQGSFYLAVSAGAVFIDQKKYQIISINSPLGLQLKGKSAGNNYTLNGKTFEIYEVS